MKVVFLGLFFGAVAVGIMLALPNGKKPTMETQFYLQVSPEVRWAELPRKGEEVAAVNKVAR